jgi:hypothetical protein
MTDLIEVKASDLAGAALDWAVAKVEKVPVLIASPQYGTDWRVYKPGFGGKYSPSTDWAVGGPLIDQHQLTVSSPSALVHRHHGPSPGWGPSGRWTACTWTVDGYGARSHGWHETSPLTAACRAIVHAKLGNTVQVPKELLP